MVGGGGPEIKRNPKNIISRFENFMNSKFHCIVSFTLIRMGPAPKGQASKVFLNLEIGDQNEAAEQEQGYKLAKEFLKSVGNQVSQQCSQEEFDLPMICSQT